jgi:hypothetical protein
MRRALAAALMFGFAAAGCKSAEEECEEARVTAEQAWQSVIDTHEMTRTASIAAQAEAKTKLVREVEPRLSDKAAQGASARYDRSSDAWQRAFESTRNALCAEDPECAQLKRENAQAQAVQEDLAEKLATERLALEAIRKTPDDMRRTAMAVIPDTANDALKGARKASDAAAETCKDVPPPKAPEPSVQ